MKKHFKNIALLALVLVFALGPVVSVFAIEPGRKPKYVVLKTGFYDLGSGPCDIKFEIMIDENDIIDFLKNGSTSKFDLNNMYANDPTEDGLVFESKKDNYEVKETEWDRKTREAMEKQGYYKDGRGVWVKPTPLVAGQKEGSDSNGKVKLGFNSTKPRIAEKGEWYVDDDGNNKQAKGGELINDTNFPSFEYKWRVPKSKSGALSPKPEDDSSTYNSDGRINSHIWETYVKEGNITSYERITIGYSQNGGPCNYEQTLTGGNQRGKVSNTGGYTYDYNDESDYEIDPVTGKPKVDINGNLILKNKLGPKDAVTPDDEQLTIFDLKKQIFGTNQDANDGTDNGTILPEYAVPLGFSGAVQKLGAKNNDDVRLAQLVLYIDGISKGLPSKLIDGNMGGMTQRWVMQFQKKHSLGATGLLDTPTQDLMQFYVDELIAGPANLSNSKDNQTVKGPVSVKEKTFLGNVKNEFKLLVKSVISLPRQVANLVSSWVGN
jgi:hypothetical protein